MKLYTIGYIDHDPIVHAKYLGPSLSSLKGDFDVWTTTPKECPAANYNNIIAHSKTPYIILTHQDVAFPSSLLSCIDNTIRQNPAFGALGIVGVDKDKNYLWSKPDAIQQVVTLDCCFVVIRRGLFKFDADTFDGYHMYVEDYCGQCNSAGLGCYTILANGGPGTELNHYGATAAKLGYAWGDWRKYRAKLDAKWPGIRTT